MAQHTLEESRADLEDAMASFLKQMSQILEQRSRYERLLVDVLATMCRVEAKVDAYMTNIVKEEKVIP